MDFPGLPDDIEEGVAELAREALHFILSGDHGVSPFTQSAFIRTVSFMAQSSGLPPYDAELAAVNMGAWLEGKGYIALTYGNVDPICDCELCGRVIDVTETGKAFAAEWGSFDFSDGPPWETGNGNPDHN